MDDDDTNLVLSSSGFSLMLWIAGITAGLFLIVIVVDAVRRRRRLAYLNRHRHQSGSKVGFFENLLNSYHVVTGEWERRSRKNAKKRELEK